jgi:hypothetical protein
MEAPLNISRIRRSASMTSCDGSGRIDHIQVEGFLRGKRALITGAGGSIVGTVPAGCPVDPAMLILVERAENNLFFMELELREHFPRSRSSQSSPTSRTRRASSALY